MCTILKRFLIAGLALTGLGLVNVYAETLTFSDPWMALRRMGGYTRWYNPVTGRLVELTPESDEFVSTKVLATMPGLVWKFSRLGPTVNDSFRIMLRRKEYYLIDGPSIRGDITDMLLVQKNANLQNICGQEMQVSKVLGDRGREYRILRFASDFTQSAEKLWVVIIQAPPAYGHSSTDESLFCPLVESFFPKDKPFFIPPSGEWINPLSEKMFVLPMQMQVTVDDIVANDYGFYQAYRLTKGTLQIRLQKSVYNQWNAAHDTKYLPKDTVFDWQDMEAVASTFEQMGFSKRKAQFSGKTVKGVKINGLAFDFQRKDERVFVKAWRDDGRPLVEDDHAFVQKLFENSVPDEREP